MRIQFIKSIFLLTSLTASALQATPHNHPHLSAHISGLGSRNSCFICIPNEGGCFSLQAAAKGQLFPIDPDNLQQQKIYLLDTKPLKLVTQALPASCQAPLQTHQTLQITGRLAQGNNLRIHHLQCRVVG